MNLRRTLRWGIPPLFCILLYWHGLRAWFQMDDFAWLSLHLQVQDLPSLFGALFRPMAQGTVRPLSERLFFLSFWHLFGMEALPYRILVFATQFASLALITVIAQRLTRSTLAGFLAPLLWLVSPVLYLPLTWTSAYNQILCAFFLLAQFLLLLRYDDTGHRRYYVLLWVFFLLGFGALELNVVFPAIAGLYAVLFARGRLRAVLPMFVVSVAYVVWHRSAAHALAGATYAMDYGPWSLLNVLGTYIAYSVTAIMIPKLTAFPKSIFLACGIAVLFVVTLFGAVMLRKRDKLVLLFGGWFVITLAPYLPLANHVSDYYLTVPAIGLSMFGGWAISIAWRSSSLAKLTAVVALLLFAVPCAWQAAAMSQWYSATSRRVRNLLRGVATVHARHPGRTIILSGVDDDLFWNGLYDRPETPLNWPALYLTGETELLLTPHPDRPSISDRFLPHTVMLQALQHGEAVVYDASQSRLRNVTNVYERLLAQTENAPVPRVIQAGNPLYASYLKEGWFDADQGYRWSERRASLEVRGPTQSQSQLRVSGRVSALHTEAQPLYVTLYIEGKKVGTQMIPQSAVQFELKFPLPAEFANRSRILVTLETDRTVTAPPDPRQLALLMGEVEVLP